MSRHAPVPVREAVHGARHRNTLETDATLRRRLRARLTGPQQLPRTRGCGHCARATDIGSDAFEYVDPQACPRARRRRGLSATHRGVQADTQHVVLGSGATQAIALLRASFRAGTCARHGGPVLGSPTGPAAQRYRDAGCADRRRRHRRDHRRQRRTTVLSTRAHQSKTGVVLSAARRTALVEWARAGHLIVEDDDDAEYRYDRAPVGALQGIAPDRVTTSVDEQDTGAGTAHRWTVMPHNSSVRRLAKLADPGARDGPDRVRLAVDLATTPSTPDAGDI